MNIHCSNDVYFSSNEMIPTLLESVNKISTWFTAELSQLFIPRSIQALINTVICNTSASITSDFFIYWILALQQGKDYNYKIWLMQCSMQIASVVRAKLHVMLYGVSPRLGITAQLLISLPFFYLVEDSCNTAGFTP